MKSKYAALEGPWLAYLVKGNQRIALNYPTHRKTSEGLAPVRWNQDSLIAALSESRRHLPIALQKNWVIVLENNPNYKPAGLKG